jgi:HAE1 family hydrophobic/amphiphilic exporter-1
MNVTPFIKRPVLSTVISIIIVVLGIVGYIRMPISLYPQIAPPTVQVRASYPGANAQTVLNSVVTPLEEAINGVEGMQYMSSTANNNGSASITVKFNLNTDPDIDAVNVQNRIAQAKSKLPQEVTKTGVIVRKQQTNRLLIFSLYSPNDQYDSKFLTNYAKINLVPKLKRIEGVGEANSFSSSKYTMRIWLKPAVMASYGITPQDVISSLNEQSFTAAPGAIGQNSGEAFEYKLTYKGRLSTPSQYKNIIIRRDSARTLKLDDIARVELGAQSYLYINKTNGHPGVGIFISKRPGANAKEVTENVVKVLKESSNLFPPGVKYTTLFNVNDFLTVSINKVYETLLEAFILVFIVVFIFLEDWRSVMIPAAAVPVSIIGTLFFLNLFGFSLNLLTLFALVLAIGMVVDDAIIVVEVVHARLEGGAESGKQATIEGMHEITGAIITISLVLAAIFIPVTFISGSIGVFFKEFGITLAVAVLISALNALTLSPALCALILKPEHKEKEDNGSYLHRFQAAFDAAYNGMAGRYRNSLEFLSRNSWIMVAITVITFLLFWWFYTSTPSGFVPNEDQGAFFANVSLPPSSSLERTAAVESRLDSIMATIPAIKTRFTIAGFGMLSGAGTPYGLVVGGLKPWDQRDQSVQEVIAELQKKTAHIKKAQISFFAPPAISGFGATNGFTLHLEDLRAGSIDQLSAVNQKVKKELMQRPEIQYATSFFRTDYPQYRVDVDVAKAKEDGFTESQILDAMQAYYGGIYISNFNRFGKLYRVYVQAEAQSRASKESLHNIYIKNGKGLMAPLDSYVSLKRVYGPENISRFNLYNSVQINGSAAPGYSSGDAIDAVKQVFKNKISKDYGYAFSGLARQQNKTGGTELLIFGLALGFVYLLLSALYESYLVPWSVILSLPIGLAGSYFFALMFGVNNNVYLQIAAILLMALLAKNGILIVQFAIERRRDEGMDIIKAAIDGAVARLRPILMTSFAFIAALMPLAFATGVDSNANRSIGIGTAGGMFIGMIFGLFMVPILFILLQKLQEKISGPPEIVQKKLDSGEE